jgi:hypothetical protein
MPEEESEFGSAEVTYKGKTYHFTELDTDSYDKCEELARREDQTINGVLLTRLMITKSATDPKVTLDDIKKMPLLKVNALAKAVTDLHTDKVVEKPEPGKDSA